MDTFVRPDHWFLARDYSETDCIEGMRHETVSAPDSCENGKGVWVLLEYVSCGDYDRNGSVGRSNVRVFEDEHAALFTSEPPDAVIVRGGHGYRAVAVRWEAYDHRSRNSARIESDESSMTPEESARLERWDELADTLAGLADYPLLSEDDHSLLEIEEETEAWESYGRSDFRRELTKAHPEAEEAIDAATDAQLDALWHRACDESNTYPEHTSEGVYYDFDRVVRSVEAVDLAALAA